MKLKILMLISILFLLFFMPIGLCDKINNNIKDIENIENNIKIYNKENKTIDIYDKNKSKIMNIKLISTNSDITTFTEIFKITNFNEYIPNKNNDLITKNKSIFGNNIYKTEFYIKKDVSDYRIIFNETDKTNKTIYLNNKSIWIKYNPYNKTILKNEIQKIKIIYYKKPELGFFKIQTIPIFRNIECKEFSWWEGNWNLKRAILINNTYGDNVTYYSLKSINLSEYQINATSVRIINESSGLIISHYNESIDLNGNLNYIWGNFSKINNGSWINSTYYIYYKDISNVNTISNGSLTFNFFEDFSGFILDSNKWNDYGVETITLSNGVCTLSPLFLNTFASGIYSKKEILSKNNMLEFRGQFIGLVNNAHIGLVNTYDGITDIRTNDFYTVYHWHQGMIEWVYKDGIEIDRTTSSKDENYHVWEFNNNGTYLNIWKDKNLKGAIITGNDFNSGFYFCSVGYDDITKDGSINIDYVINRKYIINEPELWTIGNIEYPEELDMNCSIKIITHLTDKKVQIVDINGTIINDSVTNVYIDVPYNSYIIYMSNPMEISNLTNLFSTLDNVLIQFFLFTFLIVIGIVFFIFLQIIKNKGFKGGLK